MTAEETLAAQLAPQLARLKMGTRSVFWLRQKVIDHTGHELPGDEHIAGWLLRSPEALTVRFLYLPRTDGAGHDRGGARRCGRGVRRHGPVDSGAGAAGDRSVRRSNRLNDAR
jgi:hypothetical protein